MPDLSRVRWRTSSFSANTNCVEVAFFDDARSVAVRDSKDRQGSVLVFTAGEWREFLDRLRRSEVGPDGLA
jgi:hypothetical protein